jgi:hypothetical protein
MAVPLFNHPQSKTARLAAASSSAVTYRFYAGERGDGNGMWGRHRNVGICSWDVGTAASAVRRAKLDRAGRGSLLSPWKSGPLRAA